MNKFNKKPPESTSNKYKNRSKTNREMPTLKRVLSRLSSANMVAMMTMILNKINLVNL